jgi:hypothetical protein
MALPTAGHDPILLTKKRSAQFFAGEVAKVNPAQAQVLFQGLALQGSR